MAFLKIIPKKLDPFIRLARLDKPIGTWLLLLPTWWGLVIGAKLEAGGGIVDSPQLFLWMVLAVIGAFLLRGAGCTINDMVDVDYDRKVERTKDRPLASGAITQIQALFFLMLQLLLGLMILLLFPFEAWIVGALSLPLILLYPFMKRITWYPQAMLGIVFNWGIWIGFVSFVGFHQDLNLWLGALMFYGAGFMWTMGYDTIYAHQDKKDDQYVGVKSTALKFGNHSRLWIALFYCLMIVFLYLGGRFIGIDKILWQLSLVLAAILLLIQILNIRFNDPQNCLYFFKFNQWVGLIIALGLLSSV